MFLESLFDRVVQVSFHAVERQYSFGSSEAQQKAMHGLILTMPMPQIHGSGYRSASADVVFDVHVESFDT
jgi:hypothetical protein